MNKNSLICTYIYNNKDTWKEDFDNKHISYRFNEQNLCIFKYYINADFNDPLCLEARGIIIDMDTLEVVCWPFDKFFNSHEQYASDINWDNCKIQEKYDGSIIKLFYNPKSNIWQWATNGVINAKDADLNNVLHSTFLDLIHDAINYKDINLNILNKDYTYIFEIVDPINHPVAYNEIKLWHIGTRNNITGQEYDITIGIDKPKEYNANSLEEVISLVESFNSDKVEHEGVVVVDNNYNRIKVKNSAYLQLHYLFSSAVPNKQKLIELIHSDDINITSLIEQFPQYKEIIEYYIKEEEKIDISISMIIAYARKVFSETQNRKEVANQIKHNKYKHFGFKALDTSLSAKEIINEFKLTNINKYTEFIKDFNYDIHK